MRMTSTLKATYLTPEKNSFSIAPVASTRVVSTAQPRSPWHSPVPYLFGGLAAMLGLIAFALLILACSYWKLSREDSQQNEERDLESGEKGDGVSKVNGAPIFEEKIVVIMAGNDKPTFLATPSLMLFSNNKDSSNDQDRVRGVEQHVQADCTNVKVDETKESTSVQGEEHDGDDEKFEEEDETTHSHN